MGRSAVWLAGPEDADAVARLLAQFRDWWGKDQPSDETIRAVVERLLADDATDYLLAAPAGGSPPVGICQLRYRLSVWTGTEDCWLEDLFVSRDAQGGGVGRALVAEAVARARARGCKRIELDVNEDNAGALALYRSMGFSLEPKPPGRTLFVARSLDSD
jgi:ribosomal protein S18 acetylase RimI-like enzyme